MQQYAYGIPKRSVLVSTPISHKGGKSGFKKSFRLVANDREKIPCRFGPINKNKLKCSHYGKTRHTKENCWDLVGHPKNSARVDLCEKIQLHHMGMIWVCVIFLKRLIDGDKELHVGPTLCVGGWDPLLWTCGNLWRATLFPFYCFLVSFGFISMYIM